MESAQMGFFIISSISDRAMELLMPGSATLPNVQSSGSSALSPTPNQPSRLRYPPSPWPLIPLGRHRWMDGSLSDRPRDREREFRRDGRSRAAARGRPNRLL